MLVENNSIQENIDSTDSSYTTYIILACILILIIFILLYMHQKSSYWTSIKKEFDSISQKNESEALFKKKIDFGSNTYAMIFKNNNNAYDILFGDNRYYTIIYNVTLSHEINDIEKLKSKLKCHLKERVKKLEDISYNLEFLRKELKHSETKKCEDLHNILIINNHYIGINIVYWDDTNKQCIDKGLDLIDTKLVSKKDIDNIIIHIDLALVSFQYILDA